MRVLIGTCIALTSVRGVAVAQITISREREGLDQIAGQPIGVPADPDIAVGHSHVVTTVNRAVAVFSKANLGLSHQAKLIQELLDVENPDNVIDPKVMFDPAGDPENAGRFLLCALVDKNGRKLYFAFTNAGAVTPLSLTSQGGVWNAIEIDGVYTGNEAPCTGSGTLFLDRPKIGYGPTAWYACVPMVPLLAQGRDNLFLIFEKGSTSQPVKVFGSDFLDGQTQIGCENNDVVFAGVEVAAPALPIGPGGETPVAYFAGVAAKTVGAGCDTDHYNVVRLYAIKNPNDAGRTLHYKEVQVPCYDAELFNWAPTLGGTLVAGDGRITSAAYVEEGEDRFLYACHSVTKHAMFGEESYEQRVIRWYKFNLDDWPVGNGSPSLDASAQIAGPVRQQQGAMKIAHLMLPKMLVNGDGIPAIVCNRTSSEEKTSLLLYACIESHLISRKVEESSVGGVPSPAVFGDFTGIAIDPDDGATIWGIGELLKQGTTDPLWTTWLFEATVECEE
jgi:hypothetical protein